MRGIDENKKMGTLILQESGLNLVCRGKRGSDGGEATGRSEGGGGIVRAGLRRGGVDR